MEGWEPREFTEYEWDGDRLVGSVTWREPEWSTDDVNALLALREYRRLTGPHGQQMDEAMSPDGDPSNPDAKFRWVAGLPSVDFAQKAINVEQDNYKKKYGDDADMGSMRWSVRKEPI